MNTNSQDSFAFSEKNNKPRDITIKNDQSSTISEQKSIFKKPKEFLESLFLEKNEKVIREYHPLQKSFSKDKVQFQETEVSSTSQGIVVIN